MPPKDDPETAALKQELQALIEQCKVHIFTFNFLKSVLVKSLIFVSFQGKQKGVADTNLEAATSSVEEMPRIRACTRRMLKGHINKVTSCHYSGDSRYINEEYI